MAVASTDDVAVVLGRPLSDAERDQVDWWLNGTELVIGSILGDVTGLNQDALLYVEVEAVAEKVRGYGNPESSITVSVDDGSVTRRYDSAVSEGDIRDDWWRLLGRRSFRALSMPMAGGPLLR